MGPGEAPPPPQVLGQGQVPPVDRQERTLPGRRRWDATQHPTVGPPTSNHATGRSRPGCLITTPTVGRSDELFLDAPDQRALSLTPDRVAAYLEGLAAAPPPLTYRLPTVAEWDRLALAGRSTRYWWGDEPANPEGANFLRPEPGLPIDTTADGAGVGRSFRPNPWGLELTFGIEPPTIESGRLARLGPARGPGRRVRVLDRFQERRADVVLWSDPLSVDGSRWWENVIGPGGMTSYPLPPAAVGRSTIEPTLPVVPGAPTGPSTVGLSLGGPAATPADPRWVSNPISLGGRMP